MANREISILLKAKNAMASGLSSAWGSLKSFGKGVWKIGKEAAIAFAAVGTVLVGLGAKAVAAFATQEAAVNSLKSALSAYGDEVENNTARLKERAAAIQDETGASDESTIANMARLRMLGVETPALDAAAKGVLALKSAGLEEAAAIKAVAMAHSGNFGALSRYIPALKNASTEAEKAALVNDFLTKGYAQQKAALGTVGGAWAALKGRVGDVWEEVGAAIAQNGQLQDLFKRAGDAVKRFGERLSELVANGLIPELIANAKRFGENAQHIWTNTGLYFGGMVGVIMDGWATAVNYVTNLLGAIKNNYVVTFAYIRDYVVAVFEKIKHPLSEFKPPSIEPVKKALSEYVDAIKGKDAKVSTMTDAAANLIAEEAQRHAERLIQIEKDKTAALAKLGQKQAEDAKKAAEQITAAKVNQAKLDAEALKKKLDAEEAALKQEIDARKEALKQQQELAKQRVGDFIKEAQGKKDEAKALEDDQKKADRLRRKLELDAGRGLQRKLSKQDQEFLKAADAIKAAQKGLPGKEAELRAKEAKLLDLQQRQTKATESIAKSIDDALELG